MKSDVPLSICALAVLWCSFAGCCPSAPGASKGAASSGREQVASTQSADACGAEQSTLAIESCVMQSLQQLDAEIARALERIAGVLSAGGTPDASAVVAASQADWERYRSSSCGLYDAMAGGGSLARIDIAYCRQSAASLRLSELRALEQSAHD
jgi:uncharacterized protein YecT (DUF1311 family)